MKGKSADCYTTQQLEPSINQKNDQVVDQRTSLHGGDIFLLDVITLSL